MFQTDKIKQQRLRILIQEYESILKEIFEEEKTKIRNEEIAGKTAFDVAKRVMFNQGQIKGLEIFLRAIYDGSK